MALDLQNADGVTLDQGRQVLAGLDGAHRVPGVVRVLTVADVPGVNDAGIKTTGAGRNHLSSTKKPRSANGTPIGLTALSTSPATISRNDACTVVSVMPYILIIRGRPG